MSGAYLTQADVRCFCGVIFLDTYESVDEKQDATHCKECPAQFNCWRHHASLVARIVFQSATDATAYQRPPRNWEYFMLAFP